MLITLLIQKYMNRWARWSESGGMRDKFDSLRPPNMSGISYKLAKKDAHNSRLIGRAVTIVLL